MYHSCFIQSSVDRHPGCFHVLAIVNRPEMNAGLHVSFSIFVFSEYIPSSGVVGSYVGFIPVFFFFLRNIHTVLSWLYQVAFPPTVQEGSLFSTPSPAFTVCRCFGNDHSDLCEVISHCSFDLHLSNNERCWAYFHVFISHLYVFFGEKSV